MSKKIKLPVFQKLIKNNILTSQQSVSQKLIYIPFVAILFFGVKLAIFFFINVQKKKHNWKRIIL